MSMGRKLRRGAAPRIGSGAEIAAQPVGGGGGGRLNPGAHDSAARDS
jgi:hypothetical protein